jgi:hypothetical protein
VHTFPAPQTVPSGSLLHAEVDMAALHIWHGFAGLIAPAGNVVPPMTHTDAQVPSSHVWPAPQVMPSGALLHADVDAAGVQTWHGLLGFTVPAA